MNERVDPCQGWAKKLGYDRVEGALVRLDEGVDAHPFAPELRAIMSPSASIRAEAVFCIDRVPTVCLVARRSLSDNEVERRGQVRSFCERLWNQNLARVVLLADDTSLEAWSVDNPDAKHETYSDKADGAGSAWSVSGLLGGEALLGRDDWFDARKRVDRVLLDNIQVLVKHLSEENMSPAEARRLVARVIFITYLEDRGIVGSQYRNKNQVLPLFDLVKAEDGSGLRKLIRHLRADFNGDFLTFADEEPGWENLSPAAFGWLSKFLSQTTLRTGQASFWKYDFSYIPIELIASIYETFLATKDDEDGEGKANAQKAKRRQGAYYTPRLLADWVVDLALEGRDPLAERIFDGACGSGMLLTAAFRRLIRAHEVRNILLNQAGPAAFSARKELLLNHIFGGDIDDDACQLTGFSLYLALLADLSPPDLEELRRGGHKLPSLRKNIRRGQEDGDFFAEANEAASAQKYTIFLSNPPWRELEAKSKEAQAMMEWQARQPDPKPHIPKSQIAAGFALGAADALVPGGRVALILPVNLFLSSDRTQRDFRAHMLGRYNIEKIVNFSDMRRLIFADANHPFVVVSALARKKEERFSSIETDIFEYWTPKTDISLAFGRLTVHGRDRALLQASALLEDESHLAIRYWGSEADIALLQRLRRRGAVADLMRDEEGWCDAKGFHLSDEDKRRPEESWYVAVPDWMRERPFLMATRLPADLPFVPRGSLSPIKYDRIARVPPKRFFEGPRVIWTDGAHPTDGVKAVYSDSPFSFQHSLAVLSAPDTEEGRLLARFLTVYLRSPMGLWLLFLLSGSVASERPKLHVREALQWPFWSIERHPDPARARKILAEVDSLLASVEEVGELEQPRFWESLQGHANSLVYDYFNLSSSDVALIEELALYAGPALQPSSLRHKALMQPLRQAPTISLMHAYCGELAKALSRWRDATGGEGEISAAPWTGRTVPIGAAVLTLGAQTAGDRLNDDLVVSELSAALSKVTKLSPEFLLTVPDLALVEGNKIFLIKPMVSRFWLTRCAIEDAGRLAIQLQGISKNKVVA